MKPAKGSPPTKAVVPSATRRRLAMMGGAGVATLVLLFALTDHPQSAPARTRVLHTRVNARTVLRVPARADTRSINAYSSLLHRDLFKPLVSSDAMKRSLASSKTMGLLPAGVGGLSGLPPAIPTASQGGWSYIGTVSVDGVPFALAQRGTSGDYGYYRAGDSLDGMRIAAIRQDTLVLSKPDGGSINLPKSSGAPVDNGKSAANGTAAGQKVADAAAPVTAPTAAAASVQPAADQPAPDATPSRNAQGQGRGGGRRGNRGGRGSGGGFGGNFNNGGGSQG